MIARELISDIFPSVKSTDQAGRALDWMMEFKLNQLPIVDHGKYIGMVTENDILDAADLDIPVGEIKYSGLDGAYIYQENHVYDAIELMSNFKLEVLPVLDEENGYLGVITHRDLTIYLGQLFAIHEPGGIMVLEIPGKSYVLSEIARIVESEDAVILSLYLSPVSNTNDMLLTLKISAQDLSRISASMERFNYRIIRIYHMGTHDEDYKRNLDALIKYLDM